MKSTYLMTMKNASLKIVLQRYIQKEDRIRLNERNNFKSTRYSNKLPFRQQVTCWSALTKKVQIRCSKEE